MGVKSKQKLLAELHTAISAYQYAASCEQHAHELVLFTRTLKEERMKIMESAQAAVTARTQADAVRRGK